MQKIITEILATNDSGELSITFARDARDLLIDCCVEFITLISSEANEIAEREAKKTIATEHIDKALKELGFPEYVREVLASAGEMKESLKVSFDEPESMSFIREKIPASLLPKTISEAKTDHKHESDPREENQQNGPERSDARGAAPTTARTLRLRNKQVQPPGSLKRKKTLQIVQKS